jgi:hypothetical protein
LATHRPSTVDDLYDQRFHNQPESGGLGMAEIAVIEAGRTAMQSLQKTLDLWLAVGAAIKVLRDKADRDGRKQVFKRLMRQNGFAMEKPDKVIDKGLVSHLLDVLARKTEVVAWHETLSPKQRREWSAPNTIKKHCPIFAKPRPDGEKKLTPAEKDRQALAAALEENERLKKQKADERFTPTDTAENVAVTIVAMFSPGKVEDICRRALAKLKARKAKAANPGKLVWDGDSAPTGNGEGYVIWESETGGSAVYHGKLSAKSVKEQRYISEAATLAEAKALAERDYAKAASS